MAMYYIDTAGVDSSGRNGLPGQEWRTLAYACSRILTAGNTIHVGSGIFNESVQSILRPGVSIEGVGAASQIRSIVGGTSFTILAESGSPNYNGNQHITNISMDGNNLAAFGAIRVAYRGSVQVSGCTITNFSHYGASFINGEPPSVYATFNSFFGNTVTNCSVYDAGNRGCLEIQGQDGMLIHDNVMTASRGTSNVGDVIYGVEGFLKNCKIYNNTLTKTYIPGVSNWDFAIELWNLYEGNEIYDNTIIGSVDICRAWGKGSGSYCCYIHDNTMGQNSLLGSESTHGILLEHNAEDIIIERNHARNICQGIAVNTQYADVEVKNIRISYNKLINVGANGINSKGWGLLWGAGNGDHVGTTVIDNIKVLNNVFTAFTGNSTMWGIEIPDSGAGTNIDIRNNIVRDFDYGPVYARQGVLGGVTIDTLSIENNNFYGNGNGNAPRYSGIVPSNNTTQNNITTNPLFVSSSDFHLQDISPCIDAGIDVGLTEDFEENPVDENPDIGAYEDQTVPPPEPQLVESITISSEGDATTIETPAGTLQMYAEVLPVDADDPTYTWSVIPGTGSASINGVGLLTASTDGTVTVKALANDTSGIYDEFEVTISNQAPIVEDAKELTVYRAYTASELKARASIPVAGDITVYADRIACKKITTTKIRTVIGESINHIDDLSKSNKVNKWSAFSPYTRSVTGTPDARGDGAWLQHNKPTAHFKFGNFAGYNHNALTPSYYNTNRAQTLIINSGGTAIFDCALTLGELKFMDGDITGQGQVLGIAFIVWDANTLIGYQVKSLLTLKDTIISSAFQITKANVTVSKRYTCQIRLIKSATAYNYNPTNVVCGITELPDYTKDVIVQSANHFYFNAPYSAFPPVIAGSTYTFGEWVLGIPSFNINTGAMVFQYLSEAARAWTGLHITAYVEEGYYDIAGTWIGAIVTDETIPSQLWDGNWLTTSAVGNTNLVIWKSGGVAKSLPVPYNGYGHRIVIKCNPNQ